MFPKAGFGQIARSVVDRFRPAKKSTLGIGGYFTVECLGADGKTKWKAKAKNGITNAGLNHVLGVGFHADAATIAWFLGLIDLASFTALAAGDTMGSHAGWIEITTEYSEATRPEWTEGAASSQSITNAATVNFSITGTKTVKGIFLTSDSVKGGITGTLWATALFAGGDQAVVSGDTLKVTYTVNATSV